MAEGARGARIVVAGCGGIGGLIAARLALAGQDVTGVARNPKIAGQIRDHGLAADFHKVGVQTARLPVVAEVDELGEQRFDIAVLAVPPDACEQAVRQLEPYLKEGAPLICCANGLVEERLSAFVSPERLVGAVVTFGGTTDGPGRVRQTSAGGFVLGQLPQVTSREARGFAAQVLETAWPVWLTENLAGVRWSKLAINCAVSSIGTVGGDRLGALMRYRFVRRLALEVMTEVVAVSRAEAVKLEPVAGTLNLDWLALPEADLIRRASPGLVARHGVLLAVGVKFRNMRSSMLSALERGRTPPVDYLNGEVVSRGVAHNIPTPINAALVAAVHELSETKRKPSLAGLRALYERTRR
jgi:2-dehydropantoate 2-reductase